MSRSRILMCPPTAFGVEYVINPWMEGNVGRVDRERARRQWDALFEILNSRAEIELLEPVAGLPDLCFTANGGLVLGEHFVPSVFRFSQRAPEVACHRAWAVAAGFRIAALSGDDPFEGEGDALLRCERDGAPVLFAGYGSRTALESHRAVAEWLGVEVVSLRLVDPRFYHLDTCFAVLPGGVVLYHPPAFDEASRARIEARVPEADRIAVGADDALAFACNALVLDAAVITAHASPALRRQLEARGLEVVTTPLDEFLKAGGGAKCLALDVSPKVDPERARPSAVPSLVTTATLEAHDHLLDGGLLNRALDAVAARGGSVRVASFRAGERRELPSQCCLEVSAPTAESLAGIVERLLPLGFRSVESVADACTEAAPADGVAPEAFYATTIYPTEVRWGGGWRRATDQRMDAVLVLDAGADPPALRCRLIRDLRAGDRVVCGDGGVRVRTPSSVAPTAEFAFMSGSASSERRVEYVVEELALEMRRLRARGAKIVVVAGPVVIHTGGGPALAALVREGFVQVLLAGNALAVHDVESTLFGTSLGIDLQKGSGVHGGHRHHLRAINRVRAAGSLAAAVESGLVTSGIVYECVQAGVELVLAGSIRDDGPLPDTITDQVAAQDAYARALRGADLVLMLASMLHSIGVGNMTPAGVRLVCVDIQPATVTKLADRGSLESVGVVTDVGPFLALLARRLGVV